MRFGPHIKALHSSISLYFFNIEKISAKTCLKLMQPKTRPLFGFTCTVMQVRGYIYLPKSIPPSWKLVKTQNSASCPPLHQNWPGKKRQQRCNSEGLLDPQQWEMRSQPVLAALKCCSHSVSAAQRIWWRSLIRRKYFRAFWGIRNGTFKKKKKSLSSGSVLLCLHSLPVPDSKKFRTRESLEETLPR